MREKKHWVEFLSEVGRPLERLAWAQVERDSKKKALCQQIEELEQEFRSAEDELHIICRKHWTDAEISEAITEMMNYNSHQE